MPKSRLMNTIVLNVGINGSIESMTQLGNSIERFTWSTETLSNV